MSAEKRAAATPELLMPAGGFDAALASIEGGADALYLGFEDFSARKQARNFDRLEYRRLRRFARERGVRLYAALNTIALEDELPRAASLLAFLGRFPPDAIIVQDWGMARLIRERHPGIAVHASTQAAVQGPEALKLAREMGACRVVLPRETSIVEIAALHRAVPGVELEVFVHGALCYSFSGLCLASGMVLGRSGNRGECAQLCRSYYDAEGPCLPEEGSWPRERRRGYWFSCRDLRLDERVMELARAGVASLKVEGRMKSPEYCYAVARLYRGRLDRLAGGDPSDEELRSRLEAATIAFARSPTEGWAFERGGKAMIDHEYPGHRGVRAGRVVASTAGKLELDLETSVGLRDGLLAFERADRSRPLSFSVAGLRDAGTGKELRFARAGSRVAVDSSASFAAGDEVRKLSSREQDRKDASLEEFEPDRTVVPARPIAEANRLSMELSLPRFDCLEGELPKIVIEGGESLSFERGRTPGGFARAASIFAESGEADIRLEPKLAGERIAVPGEDGSTVEIDLADAFLPPSQLKREKNRIYARAAESIAAAESEYAAAGTAEALASARARYRAAGRTRPTLTAPPRARLTFPREGLPCGLAFATPRILRENSPLPKRDGRSWLPLAPLAADREAYMTMAASRVESELKTGPVCVGLGSLHHVALARELRIALPEAAGDGRLAFFLDFGLYVANALALLSLDQIAGGVAFAYFYVEAGAEDLARAAEAAGGDAPPLVPCGEDFEPPLFQSLACFLKHDAESGICPRDCAKQWSCSLSDRDRNYRVIVEDCVTTVYRNSRNGGRGV